MYIVQGAAEDMLAQLDMMDTDVNDWEGDFLESLSQRVIRKTAFTMAQRRKLQQIYDSYKDRGEL